MKKSGCAWGKRGSTQAKQGEETETFVFLCYVCTLLPGCANFPLANSGPSLYPFLDEPCFLHFSLCCLSSAQGHGFPCFRETFPVARTSASACLSKHFAPVEVQTLQLGNGQLRGGFNGHLQQVGSKHFYCALEAPHTHVTAEYGLQDHISVNKSHFPSRKKQAFSCTLLYKLWSSYLTIITTETMTTSNMALNSKFQLEYLGWFLIGYLMQERNRK